MSTLLFKRFLIIVLISILVLMLIGTRTLRPGDTTSSELVLRNYGRTARQVWIGYSILDPNGRWVPSPADARDRECLVADLAPFLRPSRD